MTTRRLLTTRRLRTRPSPLAFPPTGPTKGVALRGSLVAVEGDLDAIDGVPRPVDDINRFT
jgi:hypothetical protein